MVSILLMLAALGAAMAVMGARRWRRARLAAAARTRAGASAELAIYIRSYADMDEHLGRRWCACGGFLERMGEGTRESGGRRYRIARLACQECERVDEVFFDTTDILH